MVCTFVNKFAFWCLTGLLWGVKLCVTCFEIVSIMYKLMYDLYTLRFFFLLYFLARLYTYRGFRTKMVYLDYVTCSICIVLGSIVHKSCVLYFCICVWSVQYSMCYMDKHDRTCNHYHYHFPHNHHHLPVAGSWVAVLVTRRQALRSCNSWCSCCSLVLAFLTMLLTLDRDFLSVDTSRSFSAPSLIFISLRISFFSTCKKTYQAIQWVLFFFFEGGGGGGGEFFPSCSSPFSFLFS